MGAARIGPRDQHEIRRQREPRIMRRADLADRLLAPDHLAPGDMPAPLRRHLVLDMQPGEAGADVFLDRADHVDGVAEPGIRIGDHRRPHRAGDQPGVQRHLGQGDQPGIGQAQQAQRGAVPGHVQRLMPGVFQDARGQRVVAAGQHQRPLPDHQRAEAGAGARGFAKAEAHAQFSCG